MITPWGSSITFEVSSAAPDAEPVWVDLSSRVIVANGSALVTSLGRSTELDNSDPGHAQFVLLNNDEALTPGNVLSPYHPWWKQSRRFRVREIIGYLGFELMDGYLEIPENTVQMQEPDAPVSDAVLRVSGVDIMGRFQNSRPFVSTLAEHIIFNGGDALAYYFPLGEAASPATAVIGSASLTAVQDVPGFGQNPTEPALPSVVWAGGNPAPGDDLNGVRLLPSRDITSGVTFSSSYHLEGTVAVTLSAGQVATIVVWVRAEEIYSSGASRFVLMTGTDNDSVILGHNGSGVLLALAAHDADWIGSVAATESGGTARMFPVAIRYGFDPDVVELWTGSNVYTDTMSVTSATASTLTTLRLGEDFHGDIAHVQIYVGAESDWTHDDFLAQYEMGLIGLERQTTGERINTILNYAQFPAGRRDIAPGVSVMQSAQLAGRTVQAALAEATDTERGRLLAVGGQTIFHDRRNIYDV